MLGGEIESALAGRSHTAFLPAVSRAGQHNSRALAFPLQRMCRGEKRFKGEKKSTIVYWFYNRLSAREIKWRSARGSSLEAVAWQTQAYMQVTSAVSKCRDIAGALALPMNVVRGVVIRVFLRPWHIIATIGNRARCLGPRKGKQGNAI